MTLLWVSVATCWPVISAAEEIYHWVDDQGVNHFSQSPPPAAENPVRTLEVDGSQPASYNPEEDIYNVAATQEAMQAIRDEMAENRKNQQKPSSNTETVIYYPQEESNDQTLYPPGYWGNRPHRPGNRPKPPKPVQPLPKPNPPATLRPNRP